jgi:phosphohistidine phosphatase
MAKESGQWSSIIVPSREFYGVGPGSVLEIVQHQEDSIKTLMLVGHNPTWESLAHLLIGGGNLRFPTGALARIRSAENRWSQIEFGNNTLSWLVTPKLLKKLFGS